MTDGLVIVPSDGEGYLELARTKSGRLFRKHILNKGPLLHPVTKEVINVDDEFIGSLKKNFYGNVVDIVQVPLAGEKNEHTEAPDRNIGEVVGLEEKDDKLYVVLDARDEKHAANLGKTLLGVSAMLSTNYTNAKTGEKVGPALLHACVTNRPYVTGLENYEEIVAATSDTSEGAVLLSTKVVESETAPAEETAMGDESTTTETTPAKPSLEELLSSLKTDHNIDVSALQVKAAEADQTASLSKSLADLLAGAGVVKLTAGDDQEKVPSETVVNAVAELAQNNVALSNRVQGLERTAAEAHVDALIKAGRIKPAKKQFYVDLKLSQPQVFDEVIPEEPIVKLSAESGVNPKRDEAHVKDVDAEIVRLSELASAAASNGKK